MLSLCLFDIFRGVFTDSKYRVRSSSVTSKPQASAKLSLLTYLMQKICDFEHMNDTSLKTFLGDLVTGIHRETVNDGKI